MAISSIKSEPAFLFTIITSLKYKFILHLLKDDGLNRSVLLYLFVNFIPLTYLFRRIPVSYCFEEMIRFDVKTLSARGPVSRLIKLGDTIKEFYEKAIQFHGTFHRLKITN